MSIQLDESKSTVSLEARLNNIAKVGEQRHEVILSRVRSQIADIASGLPRRCLADNHVVAVYTMGGKVMVAVGCCWGHAHGLHGLLLGDRGLALLVGPVAANGARTQPLSVHRAQSLLSLGTITESNKTITTRPAGLHIPHDTSLGDRAEGRKGLHKNLVVDLVRQIAHEDVEVVRRVLLGRGVGLVSPVHPDLLYFC